MATRHVYLDHAAAAPLDSRVLRSMRPFLEGAGGNPSSFHGDGKEAKDALDDARTRIASLIHARPDEILFTSGGTESDNLAVLGYARANKANGCHLVTSAFEHPAVLESVGHLEKKEGFTATYVSPGRDGIVSADDAIAAVRPDTVLVSVMLANNEIGTIQPVADIGKRLKKLREAGHTKAVLHTDACQGAGAMELDVEKLRVELLTINGGKIYGPKGIGALYAKRGVKLQPLQFGGTQERGIRPGTENVAGAVGLATALEISSEIREAENARLIALRDTLIGGLLARVPKSRLNGHATLRLPNNANLSFLDMEGEALLLYLDAAGIEASTGSACTSAALEPSHVILSLGLPYEVAHGSLRFSLGRATTEADVDYVLDTLPPLVQKLRAISPVRVDEKYYV
ncbi:cysteine desulfurase NifS [Candidatus Uhrbacteria bacterium RIFCSPHIGHO2_01_FULL_63_20]|uniref:Cysteine desulfurase NifS n=1 Tax=Candidatus Uhrbacteria bacterium RIFCSPHIGHO2_01_FULL_63_20 TaxID=1802385 RepID=A0A1F7TM17_9BACT|nr:MAG: cysteine desulfurase NifS [Candidatus Uhrbacteria bacterium RIFCSPHIGHO2_01_FULL_63_20]